MMEKFSSQYIHH